MGESEGEYSFRSEEEQLDSVYDGSWARHDLDLDPLFEHVRGGEHECGAAQKRAPLAREPRQDKTARATPWPNQECAGTSSGHNGLQEHSKVCQLLIDKHVFLSMQLRQIVAQMSVQGALLSVQRTQLDEQKGQVDMLRAELDEMASLRAADRDLILVMGVHMETLTSSVEGTFLAQMKKQQPERRTTSSKEYWVHAHCRKLLVLAFTCTQKC